MVSGQDLVTGAEIERAQHAVDSRGRVGHEGKVVGIGAQELAEAGAGTVEMTLELTGKEAHRLAFHPRAPLRLRVKHGPRARPVRAVVEERNFGIERPVVRKLLWRCRALVHPV